jgi:hypothetical protein
MDSLPDHESIQTTEAEVAELEERLAAAKARLRAGKNQLNGTEVTIIQERPKDSLSFACKSIQQAFKTYL